MKKLFIILVLYLLPMVASADESGTCGDNLTWKYEESTSKLTISGTGAMTDYNNVHAPWYEDYKDNILIVVIEDGVTSIGRSAFSLCSKLTSVTIPNSVTSIGDWGFSFCFELNSFTIPNSVTNIGNYAFNGCSSLISVTIPNSVTSIGEGAFYSCSKLASVNIPQGITSIEKDTFNGCSGLISITIPFSVTSIGNNAFQNCYGLTSVQITDLESWCNISFSYSSNPLVYAHHLFLNGEEIKDLVIPDGVTNIGFCAFSYCSGLTSLTIPNSTMNIGGYAFIGCSGLTSVSLSQGVTGIGDCAFQDCQQLTEVSIPETVTSIGSNAFSGTGWLNNQSDGLLYLDNCLIGYKGTRPSGDITIAETTRVIASGALSGCKNLTSIEIPNSVVRIGGGAFGACTGLNTVNIGNSVMSIGGSAFSGCSSLTNIVIPNSVRNIGESAFSGCTNLSSVELSENLEMINQATFLNCSSLLSISIPCNVATISDQSTFAGCSNLRTLIFEDGESVLQIVEQYYSSSNHKSYFLPDSPLDSIYIGRNLNYEFLPPKSSFPVKNYSPFKSKKELRTVKLGSKVTTIPNEMFAGCTNLTSVDVKGNIDKIAYSAFSGCENLCSINLPDGIKTIEESAFYHCKSLQSIYIPGSVETIEKETFSGCESLTSLTLSNGIKTIGQWAFAGCQSLNSLIIPNSLILIEQYAFAECSNIKEIKIEDGSTPVTVDGNAFNGCQSVESINLGRDIFSLGAFLGYNRNIKDLTISKTVKDLTGSILNNCTIKTITFEEGTDSLLLYNYVLTNNPSQKRLPFDKSTIDSIYIGRMVFGKDKMNYPYNSLTPFSYERNEAPFSMRIGNNIEEIGDGAYSKWMIDTLYLPKNVKKIGSSPFNNCAYLHDIFIEDGDETLEFGEGIGFYGIQLRNLYLGRNVSYPENKSPFSRNKEALTNLTIGNHVTDIGDGQFVGCKNLTRLDFPESLKRIGKQAFYGCTSLTTLDIPSNIVEVGKDAFNLCTGLTSVVIEDSEEPLTIDNNFMNCELKKVYLGRNIVYPVPLSPFSGLDYLDSLTIGSKVTAIDKSTFAACPKLKDVVSYAEIVPTTNEYAFTNSYLPNATLRVPYSLYDQYCTTLPWSLFGNIKNFEGLYNLVYLVDGEEYKKYVVEQGSSIIAESEPTKNGYTFSGWSEIPEMMPEYNVTVTGTFMANKYKLTYIVDEEEYKVYEVAYESSITPEAAPTKEGYTFSGWSEIPETMPAHNVTVTGTFTINKYKLTYTVNGEEYKSYEIEYGATITPEIEPIKEGYTFSGWSEIPETMPAHNVTVTGTFTINKYKLTYIVDGAEYKTYEIEYNATITAEAEPTKEGYTFSGWSEIPSTMPLYDVTVTGTFSINSYKLTYMIDDKVYKETMYEYGATITPEPQPEGDYATFEWTDLPQTMPAHDVVVYASYTSGIIEVLMASQHNVRIYSPNGKKLNKLQKGLNIVILCDGTIKKVIMK